LNSKHTSFNDDKYSFNEAVSHSAIVTEKRKRIHLDGQKMRFQGKGRAAEKDQGERTREEEEEETDASDCVGLRLYLILEICADLEDRLLLVCER
jgi:hypothetical protein